MLYYDWEDYCDTSSSLHAAAFYQNLGGYYSYDWRKNAVLNFRPDSTARQVLERIFIPIADTFAAECFFTAGHHFGDYDLLIDGVKQASILGYANTDHSIDSVALMPLVLSRGFHTFSLQYTGRSLATDSLLWADYIRLTPNSAPPKSDTQHERESPITTTLFPNPANEYVTMTYNGSVQIGASAQVIDLLGKEVCSVPLRLGYGATTTIATRALPSGTYKLRIMNGDTEQLLSFQVTH